MTKFYNFILFLFFAFVSITMNAQKHYESNIAIGAKGGMSISRIMFTPSVPQLWNSGVTLGATFRYIEEKHFGIIGELNLTQRGWKENFEGAPFNYNHKLTYIEMPLLSHIYFGSPKFKFFINAGPQFGYMIANSISANFDYNNIGNIPDFPTHNRYTDQMSMPIKNKFDFGITLGLGVESNTKRKHSILLEARAYYGLGNIFSSKKKDTFSASSSMSVAVTLGYMFRIK